MSDNHQGEQSFTVTFTASEWGLIRAGLYELPAKLSVPLIGKLERELQASAMLQQAIKQPAPPPKNAREKTS